MREPTVARDRERGATGVIDTLSQGYAVVNRRPWILVLPILLDLFLWMGPRLSMASLVRGALDRVPAPSGLTDDLLQSYTNLQQSTLSAVEGFNLFSLFSTSFPGLPSLMAGRDSSGPTFELAGAASVAMAVLLLLTSGSLLGAVYYTSIARLITGDQAGLIRTAWKNWLRLMALLLAALVVAMVLGVPLMGIVLLIATAAPGAVTLVVSFLWVCGIWAMFYLFFTVDAVVISGAGPLQAIRNSYAVVRSNLSASLGLIVLIWIVALGLPIVWGAMLDNPVTAAMAILGNVYVSTGLAAASMIFYRERFSMIGSRGRGQ